MNPRTANRRAFTLVEVMLCIVILSMVTAAIYATWRAILGATKASQITAAEVQRSRVAMRALEESLTYAQMYVGNARYYWFNADNGSDAFLSFAACLPGNFPRSGRFGGFPMRRVEFSLQSGTEGGRDLVLRQSLVMRGFDEDERQFPLVLMHNVKKFELGFWDERKGDWTDEWLSTNQIPRLIRVAVVTENPKRPNDRNEEYIRIISPAAVAVQPAWQGGGGAPGQPPPGASPPNVLPPGGAGNIRK